MASLVSPQFARALFDAREICAPHVFQKKLGLLNRVKLLGSKGESTLPPATAGKMPALHDKKVLLKG
jgi:hypothetical protein